MAGQSKLPLQIGDLRLIEQIGRGAFGTVFRAAVQVDHGFARDVAVKLLNARAAQDPNVVKALADEANLLARLEHPAIVAMRDLRQIDHPAVGRTWALVMELVRGITLQDLNTILQATGRRMTIGMALHVAFELADALSFAHELCDSDGKPMRLVHRDLKPANLMITTEGRLKVLDFGIAWASRRMADSTQTGFTKGTLRYMSPEQLLGRRVDARSDLFSLGLILWELLVGEPFHGEVPPGLSFPEALVRLSGTSYDERLEDLHTALDEEGSPVEALMRELLWSDRRRRPFSAAEIADRIADLGASIPPRRGRAALRDLLRDVREKRPMADAPNPSGAVNATLLVRRRSPRS